MYEKREISIMPGDERFVDFVAQAAASLALQNGVGLHYVPFSERLIRSNAPDARVVLFDDEMNFWLDAEGSIASERFGESSGPIKQSELSRG